MSIDVVLSGDSIVTKRISVCEDERFRNLIERVRDSDIGFTHLETVIHDYEGPDVYPAAEAGGVWMRSSPFVAKELKWAGFDMVSHASNHALDYSYGALRSTWSALSEVDIAYAGTGETMGDAQAPAYFDTPKGRVALVSMTSSFAKWSRAGERRQDMKGRPGVNTLRYHHTVDPETRKTIIELARSLGWWIERNNDSEWSIHPPGLHNTVYTIIESDDVEGVTTVADEVDAENNLRAIADAANQADLVLVHTHLHEWDPDGDLSDPPHFFPPFARACIDAGADIVVSQGSHAPLRGIEVYDGQPIFYDPGDFFRTTSAQPMTTYPADLYGNNEADLATAPHDATPSEGFDAYRTREVLNPPGGYRTAPVTGIVLPVCTFTERFEPTRIELHPAVWLEQPIGQAGIPIQADEQQSQGILEYVGELSAQYGTAIRRENGVGIIDIER